MLRVLPWVDTYRRGIQFLAEGAFDQALTAFDEAYNLSDSRILVLSSRAVVLERLRVLEVAFHPGRSEKDGGKIVPTSQDAARLFAILSQLPKPTQAHLLSALRIKMESIDDLLLQLTSHLDHYLRHRDLTLYLPPELLSSIGHLVVDAANNSGAAIPLAAVSSRWRSVFLEDRRIWRICDVGEEAEEGGEDGGRLLDALLAKADVKELVVRGRGDYVRRMLGRLGGNGRDLEALEIHLKGSDFESKELWKLLGLDASSDSPSPLRHFLLSELLPETLIGTTFRLPSTPLPNLRTLNLMAATVILDTTHSLPLLQSLSVTANTFIILPPPSSSTLLNPILSLPSLTNLFLECDSSGFLGSGSLYNLPSLRTVSLHNSPQSYVPILSSALNKSSSNLRTLDLSFYPEGVEDEETFIQHLALLPSLRSLSCGRGATDAVLEALTIREMFEEGKEEKVLCPLLESLVLDEAEVSVGACVALWESRKGRGMERMRVPRSVREDIRWEVATLD